MTFDNDQVRTLVALERSGSIISILSVFSIFICFASFPRLRTVSNTFVVFASLANVIASGALLISYNGLDSGAASGLCQAQAFLIEVFVQSDPWWSFGMAINVFLVFLRGTSPQTFKRRIWIYCVICYGGPLVMGILCLTIRDKDKGIVFGDAAIYCWVDRDWNPLRFYVSYIFVWICILGSMVIYAVTGFRVFRARNAVSRAMQDPRRDAFRGRVYGTATTEIRISQNSNQPQEWVSVPNQHDAINRPWDARCHGHPSTTISSQPGDLSIPEISRAQIPSRRLAVMIRKLLTNLYISDPVKRAYLRTSLLFTASVLITWLPSSMNRIKSLGSAPTFPWFAMQAAVVPLQGFWNGLIFFTTSWKVLCISIREIRSRRKARTENH